MFNIDFNFCHVILYIRVHVIRYPVETAAHVSRCTRIAATLVSVFRTLKANIVKYVYNGRHFGGMTLTLLGPTGKTTCSSTTLVTAIQRIPTVWDASLVSGGGLYWDACSWLGKHHLQMAFQLQQWCCSCSLARIPWSPAHILSGSVKSARMGTRRVEW